MNRLKDFFELVRGAWPQMVGLLIIVLLILGGFAYDLVRFLAWWRIAFK